MENVNAVKELAARRAEDAATHGYNGRNEKAATLISACAKAVRIAAHRVQNTYGVPLICAAERGEYTSELVSRIMAENDGQVPDPSDLAKGYLIRRAQGLIMNDKSRYSVNLDDPAPEPDRRDVRLDGELSVPVEVEAVAQRLELTETGRRALIAGMVPATRSEWAEHFGYSNAESWRKTAQRGRAELRAAGPEAIRRACKVVEASTRDELDHYSQQLDGLRDQMEEA